MRTGKEHLIFTLKNKKIGPSHYFTRSPNKPTTRSQMIHLLIAQGTIISAYP